MEDVAGILASLRLESVEDAASLYYAIEDSYERKLWHQLTGLLDEFFHSKATEGTRLKLFQSFVVTVARHLNQVKYVEFLLVASDEITDKQEKLQYLESIDAQITKQLPSESEKNRSLFSLGLNKSYNQVEEVMSAHSIVQVAIAKGYVHLGQFDEARKLLDHVHASLEGAGDKDSRISAAYYSAAAEMCKIKKDYNNFYRNSLMYLSSLDKDYLSTKITPEARQDLAYELAVAALLGDDIYNFGELLLHEIVGALEYKEKYTWLKQLLETLNKGDLTTFHENLSEVEKKSPFFSEHAHFLKQKICLMALIESIFEKPNGKRILSFREISHNTLTQASEVEFLVMRALSLGLIKGYIDQISQTVTVNWVQPRIMNKEQIKSMEAKLVSWSSTVDRLSGFVEVNGEGIWAEA